MNIVLGSRKQKGWTQEQLAEASGVSKATIQRIENGHLIPSQETCMALSSALGVDAVIIRQSAGVHCRLSKLLTALTEGQQLSAHSLRGLPSGVRKAFVACHKADSVARGAVAASTAHQRDLTESMSRWRALDAHDLPWPQLESARRDCDKRTKAFTDHAIEVFRATSAAMETLFALQRTLMRYSR